MYANVLICYLLFVICYYKYKVVEFVKNNFVLHR